jgi:large subunit ribosomal protein L32
MALPNRKRTKSRKRVKQYQYRMTKINLSICPKCKKPTRSHRVCLFCGYYAGREVLQIKTKDKKAKKAETKK